ncbi:hypothetical protein Bhyg_03839 [Pseudolycoriella hygida]|uniref:Uncharacterized protein n=1 Tax=Pseudolycoriella hygida TaxID=35572 RepID=A0A9Q0S7V1_9DIPT|nr:hypothetical protein Bhyg_03839 [Pseudolycoriella hygida]
MKARPRFFFEKNAIMKTKCDQEIRSVAENVVTGLCIRKERNDWSSSMLVENFYITCTN